MSKPVFRAGFGYPVTGPFAGRRPRLGGWGRYSRGVSSLNASSTGVKSGEYGGKNTIGLHLPRRLKKRLPARVLQPLVVPEAANVCWSLDFTSDVLTDGRRFRTLKVLDDYNR